MGRSLLDRFGSAKARSNKEKDEKRSHSKLELSKPKGEPNALSDKDWYAIHKLWRSSLFNEYYLKYEFRVKKAREMLEFETGFETFLAQFRELCENRQNESFKSWKESDTIESWIMPVMQALGWWDPANDPCVREASLGNTDGRTFFLDRLFVQKPSLKKHIQENKGQKQLDYARKYGILALEAKYWDRFQKYDKGEIGNKEDKTRSDVGGKDSPSALSPSGQMLAYLKLLKNEEPPRNFYGIVTDGRTWRLHHVDCPEDTFFEFDLGGLLYQLKSGQNSIQDGFQKDPKLYPLYVEAARYFYYFFSKDVLFKDNEPTFVDDVLRHRQQYVDRAEEDLTSRFIDAMRFTCNGLHRAAKKAGIKLERSDLRSLAESHLFNLLFIKSCEAKGVLPLYTNYKEKSLTYIVERLRQFDPSLSDADNEDPILKRAFGEQYSNSGNDLYEHIVSLAKHIEDGSSGISDYQLVGFKQSVFSEREKSLRLKLKLTNIEVVRMLFALSYLHEDRVWKQIPYNIFTTRQLGSIYESLLEFELEVAGEDLEFVKGQWKRIGGSSRDKLKANEELGHPVAYKGELFFSPDNSERKVSGSYYTPDFVVQYIVAKTLEPILKGKTSDQLAGIKICDPAAGSGHFLIAALNLLAKHYLEALHEERGDLKLTKPEATRFILDKCIFGADFNYRAIKLAKMGLWLETALSSTPLENLDDQLLCGDSLLGPSPTYSVGLDWEKEVFSRKNVPGFDAIVGNPPWGGELSNELRAKLAKVYPEVAEGNRDTYKFFVARSLKLIREGGGLGQVLPNTFLVQPRFQDMRFLLKRYRMRRITNLGDGIFGPDVAAPCAIIIVRKEECSTEPTFEYADLSQTEAKEERLGQLAEFSAACFSEQAELTFSKPLRKNKNSLVQFSEVIDSKDCGIKHQRNGCGLGDKGNSDLPERIYLYGKSRSSKDIPFLIGKDMNSEGFTFQVVEKRFLRWDWKEIIHDNETVYFNESVQKAKKKLLWRQTADRPIAAVSGDTYFANTLQAGLLTQKALSLGYSYESLACILNSTWFRYLYISKVMETGKVFPQVKLTYLRTLPIPVPSKSDVAKLEATYKEMVSGGAGSSAMDEVVFRMFGCSEKQIALAKQAVQRQPKDKKKKAGKPLKRK